MRTEVPSYPQFSHKTVMHEKQTRLPRHELTRHSERVRFSSWLHKKSGNGASVSILVIKVLKIRDEDTNTSQMMQDVLTHLVQKKAFAGGKKKMIICYYVGVKGVMCQPSLA